MITTFRDWSILENFGDGEELFTDELEVYGKRNNLEIIPPLSWRIDDLENGSGNIKYGASLTVKKNGISSIDFHIEEINISLDYRTFEHGGDPDGKNETREFTFNKTNIKTDVKVELGNFPFFIDTLEIDFRHCENTDGDIDLTKVKFTLNIGHA